MTVSPPAFDAAMRRTSTHVATAPAKNKNTPPTTERIDRTSFSSIKESHVGGIAQNFTDSKTSSYLRNQLASLDTTEDAILDDSSSTGSKTPEEKVREPKKGMMTNPSSLLHGSVCPCDGFRGWKGITVRGKMASKSFSDLKGLGNRWNWETRGGDLVMTGTEEAKGQLLKGRYPPGQSLLELLPMELLGTIIDLLATDIPPNGFTARNIDLMSLLLTSRGIHAATLTTLYNQITLPHSRIFAKFLAHVREHPSLGTIVRRLDFSHFNPTGAGMTARERAETLNLIPATLLQCINLTPNLREFLAQEHIDDDLDVHVIKALLTLPQLKALDLTACSSPLFRGSFATVVENCILPDVLPITRLSLHECSNLPTSVFSLLLPKLTHLTHLDVGHTRITDKALHSIPRTVQLTHLNLSKCSYLTGDSVVDFLSNHPAAKSLIYLNLGMDAKSHEMLTPDNLTQLIPHLPSTLRSVSLKGSKMDSSHIPLLLPLTKHLEELGLGRHLKLKDFLQLFLPNESLSLDDKLAWIPHTLRYIDVSDLLVSDLDLGTMFSTSCPLLKLVSEPLEVIEISAEVIKRLEGAAALKRVGWCVKELGRRGWMVRVDGNPDGGERGWKWGATFWGMKKIPVARSEVGGMYAHYMFKR